MSPNKTRTPWVDDTECLPQEFKNLARELHTFLDRLWVDFLKPNFVKAVNMAVLIFLHDRNDVPEFTDEAASASILALEADLLVGPYYLSSRQFAYSLILVQGVLLARI